MEHFDAIVVGAGIAGMYQLYNLRRLGMSVRVFEAAPEVGGTWYWNRYPGCRFDSESYTYCYSFSEELLQEWNWTEHFAPQPETFRYLQHVADKFDLRKDIEFNTRISRASYDAGQNTWTVEAENGHRATSTFLITAVGILSIPVIPKIPGRDDFKGPNFHTSDWPTTPLDLTGKRVAVVGTGATGVQVIQEVSKIAGQLTVFQKDPDWCAPLNNSKIEPAEMDRIKASYPEIFAKCRETIAAFIHQMDPRSALEVSEEERNQFFEELYRRPGFSIWMANFYDIFTDERAAATITEFMAQKIRQRVRDPAVAERLIPKDHLFGTRRVPMENGYFEVYNRANVELVDLRATPIERITESGIVTSEREREFDVIIFATGFDAIRGPLDRIDFTGVDGQKLIEKWRDGPETYMGLQISGFPNLFTIIGPHNGGSFCNIPRCAEQNVEFVTDLISYMRDRGYDRCEPTVEAEKAWTHRVHEKAETLLMSKVDSWFTSVNANLPGRSVRRPLLYVGGQQDFREYCAEVVSGGYLGFTMARHAKVDEVA